MSKLQDPLKTHFRLLIRCLIQHFRDSENSEVSGDQIFKFRVGLNPGSTQIYFIRDWDHQICEWLQKKWEINRLVKAFYALKSFFLNMTNIFRFGLQHYLNLFLFKLKKNKIITTRRRIRWEWFESVDCRADKKEKKVSSFYSET